MAQNIKSTSDVIGHGVLADKMDDNRMQCERIENIIRLPLGHAGKHTMTTSISPKIAAFTDHSARGFDRVMGSV